MRNLMILLAFMILIVPAASANPPTNVDVSVTYEGRIQVMVQHPVGNPREHYINKIVVKVNGNLFDERNYTIQNGNLQVDVFAIPDLKIGDKIEATAYCNKFGDKTGELIYNGLPPPPEPQ